MAKQADRAKFPDQAVIATGLAGRCPRCGQGKLFQTILQPVDHCGVCQLDMSFAEKGDGPAVLVILLLGFVIAGLALMFEYSFRPPFWAHIIIWPPVIFVTALFALRAMKGIMIAAQFKTSAAEGQLVDGEE